VRKEAVMMIGNVITTLELPELRQLLCVDNPTLLPDYFKNLMWTM